VRGILKSAKRDHHRQHLVKKFLRNQLIHIFDAPSASGMKKRSKIEATRLAEIEGEFFPLLICCLKICAQGRWGLFGQNDGLEEARWLNWPEANRLKDLAIEIHTIRTEIGIRNEVCDRFLDLCSRRGPNLPGEPKLASVFLAEIGK